MKVLRVIGDLNLSRGGPSVSAVNSTIAVARKGIETHVVTVSNGEQDVCNLEAPGKLCTEGVGVSRLPLPSVFSEIAHSVGYSPRFSQFFADKLTHFDLVHVHGPWTYSTLVAVRWARRVGRPVVMTPHEGLTRFDLSHARLPGLRSLKAMLKKYYQHAVQAMVFSSPLERADSSDGALPPNWLAIWHPIFDERAAVLTTPADWRSRTDLQIGMLGRFHDKKNIDLVIRALQGLPESVGLHLAGSGHAEITAKLHRIAAEVGVSHRTHWHGFVTGADKQAFIRTVDLLVMPSAYECFGIAAVEAMLAGKPVLVSPDVGVADIVRQHDAGGVVSANIADLQAAFSKFMAEPSAFRAKGMRAARAARDHFSFEAHGEALKALYERLLCTGNTQAK